LLFFLEAYETSKRDARDTTWKSRGKGLRRLLSDALRTQFTPKDLTHAKALWKQYTQQTTLLHIVPACIGRVVVLALLMELLLLLAGAPANVTRSTVSFQLYFWSGRTAAWVLFTVLMVTTYILRACKQWIESLGGSEERLMSIDWDDESRREALGRFGLETSWQKGEASRRILNTWVSLQRVQEHASSIARFVYAPFIVLTILLLSTWQRFEYFQWPVSAQILLLLILGWAVYNALILQRTAIRMKTAALAVIERLSASALQENPGDPTASDRLKVLVKEVEGLKKGVFSPFLEQPFVRALLLPTSATAAITLIELFKVI